MNGDQAETPSANDLLTWIKMCLAKMSGPEQEDFMSQLTNMVGTADPETGMDGIVGPNHGVLDRGRSGRRGARDSRRPAQDHALRAKQSASFNQRWASLVGGVGIDWPTRR